MNIKNKIVELELVNDKRKKTSQEIIRQLIIKRKFCKYFESIDLSKKINISCEDFIKNERRY